MCSSSTGDHPFNITWLKNHQIIYNSNLNSPHGAGTRSQKSLSSSSSSVGDENNAGGMHSRKHENSHFVDSTINISDYPPYSSILTIENLTSNDNGNYTCQISNHGGLVEHTAVLSVAGLYIFDRVSNILFTAPLRTKCTPTHQLHHLQPIIRWVRMSYARATISYVVHNFVHDENGEKLCAKKNRRCINNFMQLTLWQLRSKYKELWFSFIHTSTHSCSAECSPSFECVK